MTDAGVAQVTDFGIAAEPNITEENRCGCDVNQIGKHHFPHHLGTAHYSSPQQCSYRSRELELVPRTTNQLRERRTNGTTINPKTGQLYQVCIGHICYADVVREQRKWFNHGIKTFLPPGPDFVFEGQLDGGCQASGKMDVWALGTLILEAITGKSIYDFTKAEHDLMRFWIKLGIRPHDKEMRTVISEDGTKVTKTEYDIRKGISTIRGCL
jgi:serine/threonine protein kinase